MDLREFLEKNGIKRKVFAGMLGITIQHLNAIIIGFAKAGDKTIAKVEHLTKKAVKEADLLREYNIKNSNKKADDAPGNYCCAPEQSFVAPHIKHNILPDVSHNKPLEICLTVNGQNLFRHVFHGYVEDDKQSQNCCQKDMKVNRRVTYSQLDIVNDILNHGIPLIDAQDRMSD
jgi:hypothetical protein